MVSLEIDDITLEKLRALTESKLNFRAPASSSCSHWSVEIGGEQVACQCDSSALQEILGIFQDVIGALESALPERAVQEAAVQENETASPTQPVQQATPSNLPKPGDIKIKPLSYRPPTYIDHGEATYTPAALEYLEAMGFSVEDANNLLSDPLEVLPTTDFRSIYRGEEFELVYANKDKLVLAAYPAGTFKQSGMPRLPGQKEQRKVPLPTNTQEMIERLQELGFELSHGGKHWKITHPEHPTVYASMPYTPSDHRWTYNLASELNTKFGINIR